MIGSPEVDLDFSDEQEMLREMVRGVCGKYSPLEIVRALEDDPKGYSDELCKQLAELGLVGMLIPEAWGGQGQSLLDAAIVYEELGRALVPSPHFVSAVLCARALLEAGSEAQKSEWLPRIASGEVIFAPVWLEPRCGYGPRGVQLRAERQGEEFVLSGTKLHAVFAGAADRWIVLARTGEGAEEIDLFVVDPETPGIALSQRRNLGSEPTFRVDFEAVRLPADSRLGGGASGRVGSGWAVWDRVMLEGIVLAAAQAVGGARRALELTVAYAGERHQFGKPIGAFQALSHSLADAATAIEGGATLVYEAAWAHAEGKDVSQLAPMAKLFMGQAYRDVTAACQQVWGGVGFTIEYDIQLYFRRAKQLQMSWWDERHLEERVAASLLDD